MTGQPVVGIAAMAVVLAELTDDRALESQAVLAAACAGYTTAQLYAEANAIATKLAGP